MITEFEMMNKTDAWCFEFLAWSAGSLNESWGTFFPVFTKRQVIGYLVVIK